MDKSLILNKVVEYLEADKESSNLDVQAYAEHLLFWINNWKEPELEKKAHVDIKPQALNFGIPDDSLDRTKSKIRKIIEKSKIQPKKNVFESILDNFF